MQQCSVREVPFSSARSQSGSELAVSLSAECDIKMDVCSFSDAYKHFCLQSCSILSGSHYNKTFLLFFCSEGVFKCPEDQLPLDYAKVRLKPHTAHLDSPSTEDYVINSAVEH